MTGVGVLLLVACSNLQPRAREGHLALGRDSGAQCARRLPLAPLREQLIESAIVVAAGGALGVVVLYQLVASSPSICRWEAGRPCRCARTSASTCSPDPPSPCCSRCWCSACGRRCRARGSRACRFRRRSRGDAAEMAAARNLVAWQVCGCVALLLVAAMAQRVIGAIGGVVSAAVAGRDLAIAQSTSRSTGATNPRRGGRGRAGRRPARATGSTASPCRTGCRLVRCSTPCGRAARPRPRASR